MKAKLLTLLMALFAFAGSAKAHFYYRDFSITFRAENDRFRKSYEYKYYYRNVSEDIVIEEPVKSLKFYWMFYLTYDFYQKEELTELKLWYTVYNTLEGGPSENCVWKSHDVSLDEQSITYLYDNDDTVGDGKITRYYFPGEDGIEIIEDEWRQQNLSKTVLFYFEGKDKYGTSHYCKNGEEYFKVSFKIGEGANKIKFWEQETSSLLLNYYVNRVERHGASIRFNGDGSFSTNDEDGDGVMPAQDDFGEISSLLLYETDLWFDRAEDLGLNDIDASFLYRVYEEGHGNEADWNKLDLEEQELHDNRVIATIYGSDWNYLTNFAEGLELNKNYVLEVYYQVMVGKECYTLGKNNEEGTKFKFTTRTAQVIEGPIKSLMLAYGVNDNEPEYPVLSESEYPETVIAEPVYSFKIYGGEAMTEETIQNLELHAMVTHDEVPDGSLAWATIPFTDNGFGMWTIELPEPRELIGEEWQDEHMRVTYVLYIQGTDQDGNLVLFDNGGEGYKFTFICGQDTDRGIKNFTLTMNINGEEFPLSVPATGANDAECPFPLYMFKILKAEVNTYKPMKAVYFFSSLYNTADGVSYSQDAWEMTSFVKQGADSWVIDMPYGKELIEEEWLLQNTRMRKTYTFFVRAEGEDGKDYFFNNGDELYKITFTCDDADGIREMKNEELRMKNDEPIYNLAGQKMVNGQSSMVNDKLPRGIYIVGGKKVLK